MRRADKVWIFCGENSAFPGGAFSTKETAEAWIKKYSLNGCLTAYPIDVGIYDWAIVSGKFRPRYPSQSAPEFIQKFSSAYLEHEHYENGHVGHNQSEA